ncbi:MAG TPA: hypothetical protein VFA38_10330, partial [Nitrospirales bacterium]|nr:hypothetical protein [Nitrospirales bacterium]
MLLSYIVDPFLDPSKLVATNHTNYWEAVKIAESYLNLGFRVDVVAFGNRTFVPEKPYDVVIDSRHNLERWTPLVGPDCVRVFHIDTSHILFHNAAESQRLLALQQRRAVTLQPHRFERPNLGIEHADCATLLGNEATERTFRYAGKPMYRLPVPSAYRWPWPKDKDWAACRRRYLFLASAGMVHKGLDLVLEAFAARPEFELFVCAPVDPRPLGLHYRTAQPHNVSPDTNRFAYAGAMYEEQDFRRAYARELYETPNIHTVGWVDVASPQFLDLVSSCAGIIHPSCSEGASTAVVTGMHAALIPILTYESGIDTGEFGFTLDPVSVEHLGDAVARLAALSPSLVEKRARAAW